jgi:hypothetical protein
MMMMMMMMMMMIRDFRLPPRSGWGVRSSRVMTQKSAFLKTHLTKVQAVFSAVQFPCSCGAYVTLNTVLLHNTCILLIFASTCFGCNFWPFLTRKLQHLLLMLKKAPWRWPKS